MSGSQIPVIQVSHLPSAASFYSAIIQPLGIQYISASPGALHFGYVSDGGPVCIFTLQQSVTFPAPSSHITLLAQSHAALDLFYKKSLLANAAQRDPSFVEVAGEFIAKTRDLDGNMLQAVYSGRRREPIETASTAKEARRVLEWQEEVARSVASEHSPPRSEISGSTATYRDHRAPTAYRRADTYPPVEEPRPRLLRRETITTETYRRPDAVSPDPGSGGGFTGMKLVGTLLGAAAGAAVAYAMVRSESPPRSNPPRRASYDTPHSYNQSPVVERIPARSYVSHHAEQPPYVAQYTIAAPPAPSIRRIDERSHVSSSHRSKHSHHTHHTHRERSRSESRSASGSRFDRPLTILPAPSHASHKSYRSSSHSHRSHSHSHHGSRKDKDSESASYVSARSRRTNRTSRTNDVEYIASSPPPPIPASSSSRSTTTIRVVPDDRDRERRSVVSARMVPLPASRVGSYAASVAPSDSVSSVGTKRERERLMGRMRERF